MHLALALRPVKALGLAACDGLHGEDGFFPHRQVLPGMDLAYSRCCLVDLADSAHDFVLNREIAVRQPQAR